MQDNDNHHQERSTRNSRNWKRYQESVPESEKRDRIYNARYKGNPRMFAEEESMDSH
ncbi:hypothetical protein F2Q68_00011808 [Brassica cretica]|uniref:Uncharacterized protein n=1 Tax=Brassica cretica TaxID=69181 RepID=A0A8S9L1E2_BRACR|nr:hypothetical protein F2Q68_00011808 [Brassica cretica]